MKEWFENLKNFEIEMKARTFALVIIGVLVIGVVLF